MKRAGAIVLVLIVLSGLGFVSAWPTDGPTLDNPMNVHQKLTYKAIQAVYKDNSQLGSILMQYQDKLLYGAYDEDWRGGSIEFKGKTYTLQSQYHFLDPMDHSELITVDLFGDRDSSGADMAQKLYEQAVQLWRQGKREEAMLYLGRTVHILEDMSMLVAHTTPALFEDLEQFSYIEDAHDFVENDISPTVADDILNDRVPLDLTPIKWWQIPQEKQRFIYGYDIYIADNENGHMSLANGVAWAYADLIAHNAWRYMLYSTGKDINLWSERGHLGSYFWTKELKKGDWSVLKLEFKGASSITLVFKDIDMQNAYFKTLGYVEVYDKNWNLIARYAQDPNPLEDTSVTVPGDTVYIYTYVTGDDWLDDDVDGWAVRNIELHANFDVNAPSGFKTLDGREYSLVQWAVYETMQYDIRAVAGLMEKFFEDVGVTG
ncbi:Phospholipase C/P1 nuclease family protein, putative [Thermococcus sp. 4557]|uniref:phospholipase C n=1 Tax=Thermococcus sp. (strain CGMCC 1.5172 / 4557) TaxID=1042877 RepID=UPI000219E989|nr:phospholipase C [Thermococcus sp. 4557]AEK72687.1 Phospholipase C/P1 nuclease family protein, putative [Thermococcus sp. 4557]